MTENLKFWRTRYLLIPFESEKISKNSFSASPDEVFDEEEVLVAGFLKFVDFFDKNQSTSKGEKEKMNSTGLAKKGVNIILTTFDPAIHVRGELLGNNRSERSDSTPAVTIKERLTKNAPFETIAKNMQQSENGVNFSDRLWHFITYRHVFIGKDCVDWFLQNFADIDSREDAVNFGNILLNQGYFEHVLAKHGFLDGHYFYRIKQEYVSQDLVLKTKSNSSWFKTLSLTQLDIFNSDMESKLSKLNTLKPRQNIKFESRKFELTKRIGKLNYSI